MNSYTLDSILNGSLFLYQREKGYRFSIDALLLGNFVETQGRALEIGSGCGVVSLMVAKRFPNSLIYGMEIQKELFTLSKTNKLINHIDNVFFLLGDVRDAKLIFKDSTFDTVFSNPPYREVRSGKRSPFEERLIARHEVALNLRDLINVASYLLKPKGRLFLIYRTRRLPELINLLEKKKIHPFILIPIFSSHRGDAELFLIEAEKGTKREMEILGPISLYDEKGEKTSFHSLVSSILFPGEGSTETKKIWRQAHW